MEYNELKDTGIPWLPRIPESWNLKRAKYLFKVNKSVVGKESSNYNVLSLSTKGVIKRNLENGMGKFPGTFDGYNHIKPNSVLLCLFDMDVTPRIVGHVNDEGIVSSAYTNLVPSKEANSKFYYYYFLHQDKNKILLALGTGIRITLGWDVLGCLSLPVPPLETQNNIVAYLDRKTQQIQEFIAKKERLIELLEEQKRSVINKAITTGIEDNSSLVDTKIEWLDKVPNNWFVKKLKYITTLIADGTHVTPNYTNEGFPFLRITDIDGDVINWNEVRYVSKEEHKLLTKTRKGRKGDVLLSKNGTIGKVIEVTWDEEFSFFVSLCLLRFKKVILPKYFSYFFKSDIVFDQLNEGSKSTSVTNLHLEKIKELIIAYPIIKEQEVICKYLDTECGVIDLAISKARIEIEKVKEYQESLITQLVTGQLKVPKNAKSNLGQDIDLRMVAESNTEYASKPYVTKK